MASHSKRLPHLGTRLPTLPALQGFSPHCYSLWRIPPSPARFLHVRSDLSVLCRISIPQCIRPLHALAGNISSSQHYSRDGITRPTLRLDISLQLSTDHDLPRTPDRVSTFPPGQTVVNVCRMSQHHPAASGFLERLHRALKAAMCHADEQWTEAVPLVFRIRITEEDLQSSAAELLWGELLASAARNLEPFAFIQLLRHTMDQLRPAPAARLSPLPCSIGTKFLKCRLHRLLPTLSNVDLK